MYTPASLARYGAGGIASLANTAVAETTQAYANSQIDAQMNLVYTGLVGYTESGNMSTDLERLTGTGDGYIDNIHTLRNNYGADLVILIEEATQYCGIGWVMSSLSAAFQAYAFTVVSSDCATGYYRWWRAARCSAARPAPIMMRPAIPSPPRTLRGTSPAAIWIR